MIGITVTSPVRESDDSVLGRKWWAMRSRMVVWLGVTWICASVAHAEIAHEGGWHSDPAFRLVGQLIARETYSQPHYSLNGGRMQYTNEVIACATFTHNAGTNRVLKKLGMSSMNTTYYILHSGLLNAESVVMDPIGSPCRFNQYGGVHRVNRLVMQTYRGREFFQSIYTMEWGELEVRDVTLLDMVLFEHKNGTVRHSGLLTMAGGTWKAKPGLQELGEVLVARSEYGSSNSTLSLPASPCVMRFADSRAQNWETGATLFIRHWNGSLNGGGEQQVFFGDGSGITTQQLAQIRFMDVVGRLPGVFPATQAPNGEIVPVIGPEEPPILRITVIPNSIVLLTWPVGYTLQSATNAAGPFEEMWRLYHTAPDSSGSYADWWFSNEQMRVYRLRK